MARFRRERTGHAHARGEGTHAPRRHRTAWVRFKRVVLPGRTRAAATEAPLFGNSSMGTPPRAEGVAGRGVHGWLSGKPVVPDLHGSSS
jgi:hypothetical protein